MTRCSRSAAACRDRCNAIRHRSCWPISLRGPSVQDRLAGELGAIVRDDACRFSVDPDQRIQLPRHPGPRDARVGNQGEVFTAAIVVDCQDTKLPASSEGVGQKVQGPALVRPQRHWHWCPTAACPLTATSAAHRQSFFAINTVEFLFVHHHALALQQNADAPVAETAPLLGDLVHFQTDIRIFGRPLAPHRLRIDTDQDAGPALRDRMILHRPQHCVPPLHRRRQGFPSKSFSTTLSSMVSASKRFNLAFSSSSCLSRLASDNSIPPYLDFSL